MRISVPAYQVLFSFSDNQLFARNDSVRTSACVKSFEFLPCYCRLLMNSILSLLVPLLKIFTGLVFFDGLN